MLENILVGNLFEELADLIAKRVDDDSVPFLKIGANNQFTVVGNVAAKADEQVLEFQVLEGMKVRMGLEEALQLLERYKQELEKEQKRTDMWKEKYEEVLNEKEMMQEEYEEELRCRDEEIKKLRTQLEYEKDNPRNVNNYIQGSQYNIGSTNKPSQLIKEELGDVGVQNGDAITDKKNTEEMPTANSIEDIKICRFIFRDKIKDNTTYGRTEEERIDAYNRRIYRESQKPFPKFVKFLKLENDCGNMSYDTEDLEYIYDHFVECYGNLHANYTSFRNACNGVMNGRSNGFYWKPHE